MFIILIGSVARGDHNVSSDIDICRISSNIKIQRREEWPSGPINYIDYTDDEFMHLFNMGSLFIYHIIHEGILLYGDKEKWKVLCNNFLYKDNYSDVILDIKSTIFDFININIFGDTFLTLYSNMFTLIKNYSIFTLSQQGVFIFNKEQAIYMKFGKEYYDLLNESYNRFERGIAKEVNKWDYTSRNLATQVINYFKGKMEGSSC
jgi:predicted nucleotidyltransferase